VVSFFVVSCVVSFFCVGSCFCIVSWLMSFSLLGFIFGPFGGLGVVGGAVVEAVWVVEDIVGDVGEVGVV
jgi:hypothetical protein